MSQLAVMLEWLQDTPPLAGDQLFIEKADWKVALSLVQPIVLRGKDSLLFQVCIQNFS